MRSTLALVAGMAQPVACAAPPARDARAPLSRFSHARTVCFLHACRSQVRASWMAHGRAAGDSALCILLRMAAEAALASRGKCRGQRGRDGGLPLLLEITRRAPARRRGKKNSDTLTGTIRAYLNIFQRFLQR